MKIQHTGERPRVVSPYGVPEFEVKPGEVFDVEDELASSLLEQPKHFTPAPPEDPAAEVDDR